MNIIFTIIVRDLTLYWRRRSEWAMPLIFFIMVISLFPMALGFYLETIAELSPAIIWVAVVLALMMSLEGIYRQDYLEGILEQWLLSPYPLAVLLLGKSIAHWLALGIPLFILAPFFNMMLQGNSETFLALSLTLLLGIPTLSLIGNMGAALTIGLPQAGVLLTILVLPFMIPIIIFATSAMAAASLGLPFAAELLWLSAIGILALVLAPLASAAAVRISVMSP